MTKLNELKALMAKTTPGPWVAHHYGIRDRGGYICELHWPHRYEGQEERYTQELAEREADARLMAELPNTLPTLIAAVEALKEISKGEGEFDIDPFEHAKNCIHDMKAIARAALAELGE